MDEGHQGGKVPRYDNPWLFARQGTETGADLLDRDNPHPVYPDSSAIN